MSINNGSSAYDIKQDVATSRDKDAEAGSGGGDMEVWHQGRQAILDTLTVGNFSDGSSYGLPAGVVNSVRASYDTSQANVERFLGVNASGDVQTASNDRMPGTAILERDGEAVAAKDVIGLFVLSGPAPGGVTQGANKQLETFDFYYTIDLDGLSVIENDIGASLSLGTVVYGELTGTVTDYNGDPVPNAGVDASDGSANTDDTGAYSFNAPGGTEVTVQAAGKSKTANTSQGVTETINFQYAGLEVDVSLPNGDPIAGASVGTALAEDSPKSTGETGRAQFVRALAQTSGTIQALGSIERDLTTNDEGVNYIENIDLGVGFTGSVTDSEVDVRVRGVDIKVEGPTGITEAFSNRLGSFSLGSLQSGEVTLRIAEEDHRYSTVEVTADLPDGTVVDEQVLLERADNIGNAI